MPNLVVDERPRAEPLQVTHTHTHTHTDAHTDTHTHIHIHTHTDTHTHTHTYGYSHTHTDTHTHTHTPGAEPLRIEGGLGYPCVSKSLSGVAGLFYRALLVCIRALLAP